MPLQGELDEPVDELRVGDARVFEQLRVDARRGEAGDRVQLVQEHLALVADEEIDARHALALAGDEGTDGQLLHSLDRLLRQARRTATVTAATPLRALVVTGRDFGALLEHQPAIQLKVLRELADRLARDAV